ncbi:MAG: AEC family transporter [Saprospiraceae bacterium]|nr:AEC family transporter [Saprospiraceae bacterium]
MHIFNSLLTSILVLVIIAVLSVAARQRGILEKTFSASLAKIVFDFGVPAMIFVNLANVKVEMSTFAGPAIMMAAEICMMLLAWAIGRKLGLTVHQLGAVVLCAGFGTSATLGYSIIANVFPDNQSAMEEAVLISEVGVGLMILTLGPILAMYFGSGSVSLGAAGKSLMAFTRTPTCIALIAGICWGVLGLPGEQHPYMYPVFRVGHLLAGLVVPLSVLIVSLNLYWPDISQIIKPFGIVVVLKLLMAPLLTGVAALAFGLPEMWRDDLVIMTGLPPAVLNVILLQRYGGDAGLASTITAGASLFSLATLLLVIAAVG